MWGREVVALPGAAKLSLLNLDSLWTGRVSHGLCKWSADGNISIAWLPKLDPSCPPWFYSIYFKNKLNVKWDTKTSPSSKLQVGISLNYVIKHEGKKKQIHPERARERKQKEPN